MHISAVPKEARRGIWALRAGVRGTKVDFQILCKSGEFSQRPSHPCSLLLWESLRQKNKMKHKPKFWVNYLYQMRGLQMFSCSVGYFTSITEKKFLPFSPSSFLFLCPLRLPLLLPPLSLFLFLHPVDCMLLFFLNSQSLFCKCLPVPTEVIMWRLFFILPVWCVVLPASCVSRAQCTWSRRAIFWLHCWIQLGFH